METMSYLPLAILGLWLLLSVYYLQASRKPETNGKAALGLGGFFAALGVFAVADALSDLPSRVARGLGVAVSGIGCVGLLVALALAVWGLVEIRRAPDRWSRGRGMAWWAVALSAVLGLVLASVALQSISSSLKLREAATEGTPAGPVVVESLNFSVTVDRPWQQLSRAADVSEDAAVAFLRADPAQYFMVIAEAYEAPLTLYADVVLANAAAVADSVEEISRSSLELSGLEGLGLEATVVMEGRSFDFLYGLVVHNGFAYQLISWSDSTPNREPLSARAMEVFASFEILDPDRQAELPEVEPYRSPYGFSVEALEGWSDWSSLGDEIPAADFGALSSRGEALVVLPLLLPDSRVTDRDLLRALLGELNVDLESVNVASQQVSSDSVTSGFDLQFRDEVDGTAFQNVARLRRTSRMAYLSAAWHEEALDPDLDRLTGLLDFVRLEGEISYRAASEISDEAERAGHARIYRALAGLLESRGLDDEAGTLFREAFELDPEKVDSIVAYLSFLDRQGDSEVGLRFFEEVLSDFDSPELVQSFYPYFLAREGRLEEAAGSYSDLFADGWRSDSDFELYLDLLWQMGRTGEAVARASSYHEAGGNALSKVLLASALRQAGDVEEALELLAGDSPEALPLNPRHARELIHCHYDAGHHDLVLALTEQSAFNNGPDAPTLVLQGKSEAALQRFDEAIRSFEQALELDPFHGGAAEELGAVRSILAAGREL